MNGVALTSDAESVQSGASNFRPEEIERFNLVVIEYDSCSVCIDANFHSYATIKLATEIIQHNIFSERGLSHLDGSIDCAGCTHSTAMLR